METWCLEFKMENKIINQKNREITNVALMVKQICQDYNNYNYIRYINISVYSVLQRKAPVALMVKHSSNKRGLPRLSGSNPGWGASAFQIFSSIKGGFLN